jgi:nicotinate phosphoribosyltransferase
MVNGPAGFVPDPDEEDDTPNLPGGSGAGSTALWTDLYHVDSAYVAWKSGQNEAATFDLYTRSNPFGGGFMVVAGLEPALEFLHAFRYADDDLVWLAAHRPYEPAFFDALRDLRFSGEMLAMAEGEVAFPTEPLLRITAPFMEALILESGLLRIVGVSTLIATKAARLKLAAQGRSVSDFAFRRAHDPFLAARAAYLGGVDSTSFVAAAKANDIPAAGTIPHALVQAFPGEEAAFRAVAEALPSYSLLLDTYDVPNAIGTVIRVARDAEAKHGHTLAAVRLDSGDLAADSRLARGALDAAGMPSVKVLVSGDIDEFRIADLLESGAPIDGFGVGGNLGVGLGSVASGTVGGVIGAVYKLVWYGDLAETAARIKLAGSKSTLPGKKQAWRLETFDHDLLCRDDEQPLPEDARPLLQPVLRNGRYVSDVPDLAASRARAADSLAVMPDSVRALKPVAAYRVVVSDGLERLRNETMARFQTRTEETRRG